MFNLTNTRFHMISFTKQILPEAGFSQVLEFLLLGIGVVVFHCHQSAKAVLSLNKNAFPCPDKRQVKNLTGIFIEHQHRDHHSKPEHVSQC